MTAERWKAIIKRLGFDVSIVDSYDSGDEDVAIVIHAGRHADSIRRFKKQHPDRRLIVAITGTDVYTPDFDRDDVRMALKLADDIVVLQPRTASDIDPAFRDKVRVIMQSVMAIAITESRPTNVFEICVIGHLRPVKDPFRAAEASRLLPESSKIRILHLGAALSPEMDSRAQQEMAENPRYRWLGDLGHDEAMRILGRCRLMVLSSLSEGGPAVIPEAIAAGVPVVATRVSGCIGMLGDDYSGYFEPGDTGALAALLTNCECNERFYRRLVESCDLRRPLFDPDVEFEAWRKLLN